MKYVLRIIGGVFQWGLRELGAKSFKFHGGFGYDTIVGSKSHNISFIGKAPYWGTEMVDISPDDSIPHKAHYAIPGVAMIELEWE